MAQEREARRGAVGEAVLLAQVEVEPAREAAAQDRVQHRQSGPIGREAIDAGRDHPHDALGRARAIDQDQARPAGPRHRARRRRRRPRLPGGQHRLQLRLQRRLVEVARDDQRRVVRPVVGRVKSAHVVERDRVDRPLEPVDGLAVRVGVAEQGAIGDDVDDRLGLIAALHDARPPVVVNALPVSRLQPRAGQDVGGHRHRRAEGLARRLHRQLRAVASTPQPQIGAQLLQLRRDAQRVARARALVQHLGGDRRQPGASRADRRRRRCGT